MAVEEEGPDVVVGVDGSKNSINALAWAAKYVEAMGGTLHAILTWHFPTSTEWVPISGDEFEQGARLELEGILDKARSAQPTISLEGEVVCGSAATVLIDASKQADLLVVGTRGHGGFTGLLLGSVSSQCVHHAHCPVVVVRPKETQDPSPPTGD